jgi:thiamine-phosphate pyrophosphorylase
LEELDPAAKAGVDYIGFGAIFATGTKPDAEFAGLDLLEQACSATSLPVVGIGGIDVERAPDVIQRGAAAVAVVSALFRAPDPSAAAAALLRAVASA